MEPRNGNPFKEVYRISKFPLIINLDQIDELSISMTGSKASNLTVLINAGFNVPKGLVLTTEAYTRFIDMNQLNNLTETHLSKTNHEDATQLNEAANIMRKHIAKPSLPKDVTNAVTTSYKELTLGRVAIIS
jgi:pyruvate,water dikinase